MPFSEKKFTLPSRLPKRKNFPLSPLLSRSAKIFQRLPLPSQRTFLNAPAKINVFPAGCTVNRFISVEQRPALHGLGTLPAVDD